MSPQDLARTLAEIGYAGVDLVDQEHWPFVGRYEGKRQKRMGQPALL